MCKSERKGNYSIWFKSVFLDTIKFFCNCNIRCFVARILFWYPGLFRNIFLRPYTGGYHADTEIKCCILSVGIVNIAMLVRKINEISLDSMLMIYLCFVCVIVLFSPVDNPIHPLSKADSRIYAKRSRQLVLGYSFLLAISIALRIVVLRDSIIYTILIVGVSVLAGKWKYRKRIFVS